MNLEEMTMDEKLDLLIKYQRKAISMQRARMIGSIVLFFLLVVAPIIMFAKLMQSIDIAGTLGKVTQNLDAINEATGSFGEIGEFTKTLNNLAN